MVEKRVTVKGVAMRTYCPSIALSVGIDKG